MKRLAYFALFGVLISTTAMAQGYGRFKPSRSRGNKRSTQRTSQPGRPKSTLNKTKKLPKGVTEHFTRNRSFNIPFNLEEGARPTEVQLYYAINGGAWKFYGRQDPRKGNRFRFRTVQDGDYWFATRTVEDNRAVLPGGILTPELRVVIDSSRPKIKMEATVKPDGQVRLAWTVTDDHELDTRSMIVEVHTRNGGWTAVPLPRNMHTSKKQISGLKTWYSESSSDILHVRIRVRDRAKNISAATRRVQLPASAKRRNNDAEANTRATPPIRTLDEQQYSPLKKPQLNQRQLESPIPDGDQSPPTKAKEISTNRASNSGQNYFNPNRPSPNSSLLDPNYYRRNRIRPVKPSVKSFPRVREKSNDTAKTGIPATPVPKSQPLQTERLKNDVVEPEAPKALSNESNELREPNNRNRVDAKTVQNVRDSQFPRQSQSPLSTTPKAPSDTNLGKLATNQRTLPKTKLSDFLPKQPPRARVAPSVTQKISSARGIKLSGSWDVTIPIGDRLQMTRSSRFKLQYDVNSIGPAGVAEVTLFVTNNGGRSWLKWGTDPDLKSPFDLELKQEGIYGFRIVVAGRNGLTGDTPQPGDLADLWVGVDLSKPTAKLTSARYGSGQRAGQLELRWQAVDRKMGPRPVTLSYATNALGPWTPIAAGIPNTGQYYWQIDRSVPKLVFLRLEVKDSAGNIAVHKHSDPIRIDGVVPKARIRSVIVTSP